MTIVTEGRERLKFFMKEKMLKIFIGYDEVESVAWHTMAHSIFSQSTRPVSLTPINVKNFGDFYQRKRNDKQSNEFSFSRFLVPFLCDYSGWAVYFDCDMLLRCDIAELFRNLECQRDKAVLVVKHDYIPKDEIKYLNTAQHSYPRKNWSSVVLWNCDHPANNVVTPDFVNSASPAELHRFLWLSDDQIGELDLKWNWLVGEYQEPPEDVKNVHWTIGGPYFREYADADFASDWYEMKSKMTNCLQLEDV